MILVWTLRIITLILGIVPLILTIPAGICFFIAESIEDYVFIKEYENKDAARIEKEVRKYYGK